MRTEKQIQASRVNGAKSRGPKTLEGKRRSSQNALKHGHLSEALALSNEDRAIVDDLFAHYVARFRPRDAAELGMIEEMTAAYWRIRRIWKSETALLDRSLEAQPPGSDAGRTAGAFSALAAGPELDLLHRYETRLHRMFQRSLNNLLKLHDRPLESPPLPIDSHLPPSVAQPSACASNQPVPNEPTADPPAPETNPLPQTSACVPLPNEPDMPPALPIPSPNDAIIDSLTEQRRPIYQTRSSRAILP